MRALPDQLELEAKCRLGAQTGCLAANLSRGPFHAGEFRLKGWQTTPQNDKHWYLLNVGRQFLPRSK
jgi:hypothetical protein